MARKKEAPIENKSKKKLTQSTVKSENGSELRNKAEEAIKKLREG
jgi:hypothetical protein